MKQREKTTMDYYLKTSDDSEPIHIGRQSFGFFYPEHGFDLLYRIVESNSEDLVNATEIVDDKGRVVPLNEFIEHIENLVIRTY